MYYHIFNLAFHKYLITNQPLSISLLNSRNNEQLSSCSNYTRQPFRVLLFGAVLAVITSLFSNGSESFDQKRSELFLGAVAGLELLIYIFHHLVALTGNDPPLQALDAMYPYRSYIAWQDLPTTSLDLIPIVMLLVANILVYSVALVDSHPTQIGGSLGLFFVPIFSWTDWLHLTSADFLEREVGLYTMLNRSTRVALCIGPCLVLLNLRWHPGDLVLLSGIESVVFLMAAIVLVSGSSVMERSYVRCVAYMVL